MTVSGVVGRGGQNVKGGDDEVLQGTIKRSGCGRTVHFLGGEHEVAIASRRFTSRRIAFICRLLGCRFILYVTDEDCLQAYAQRHVSPSLHGLYVIGRALRCAD